MVKNGVDAVSVEGVVDNAYLEAVADRLVTLHSPRLPVTVLWWRSVGNTHTAFAMESMIDELAHAAGRDPLEFRLALLAKKPRHQRALKTAAEKAGWGKPLPPRHARGLAMHESFGSIIAEVAEVSVDEDEAIHVHKVSCAVDCATAINPLGIEAQMQGAIAFGLSAVLHSELTLKEGRVEQSNFHDYRVLRMPDMPEVSVEVLESDAKMGGIGEPAVAPISAAVANAVHVITKQRLRSLPLRFA
jgi:isoquinoline 1-oxidoreductase beta subunit